MSVNVNNAIIKSETAITPTDDTEVAAPHNDGFYVGTGGDVTFSYIYAPTVKHTKTFNDGDTWFGRIYSIDATSTTATGITGIHLDL
jgi:hypothetical protein